MRSVVVPAFFQRIAVTRWRAVVVQSARDLWASSAVEWSAAIAFYAVLSLLPLLILGMVLLSYVADADWATREATRLVGEFIPRGQEEIETTVNRAIEHRGRVGALSLVIFVVTGRRVLGVLNSALNHVSDVDERQQPLLRRALVELGLAAGLVALGLLALLARPLMEVAWSASRLLPGADGPAFAIVHVAVRAVLLAVLFGFIYAFVPRGERRWQAVLIGAVVATVLFLIAQGAFALLIGRILEVFRVIYGPLAFAALLMSWAWYASVITLAGGTLASHVKVMILEGKHPSSASDRHVEREGG